MQDFEFHPLHPGDGVPIFISQGVIKEPAQLEPFYEMDRLLVPSLGIGGFTMPEWGGNAKPGQQDFVYYPDQQMAGNCRGLPNLGKEGILAFKEPISRLNHLGIRTIIQVANLPFEKPVDVIPELVEIAASVNPTAVEINLSCPNGEDEEGNPHPPLSGYPDVCEEVVSATRHRVGLDVTLGAKDSSHVTSLDQPIDEHEVLELSGAIAPYIDFIVGINSIEGQSFPELAGGGRGGMSGPVVAQIARQHLRLWRAFEPSIPYLSTGGVDSQNAHDEIPGRLAMGAMLVGGAQEFYRSRNMARLAIEWAIAATSESS